MRYIYSLNIFIHSKLARGDPVRIDPQYLFRLCLSHMRRLNWDNVYPWLVVSRGDQSGSLSDETAKTEVRCHSNCGTIKIPTDTKTGARCRVQA